MSGAINESTNLASDQVPALIIRPSAGWIPLNFRDLWAYRELFYFLVWRDVKVRYKQTVLGVAWAVIQPFTAMVIFTVIFGRLARLPSDGLPYPIFTYTALLPWNFFAMALSRSGNSIVSNSNLITKVYFPRLIVPTAAAIVGIVDFVIALMLLMAMMVFYNVTPTIAVLALPGFLVLAFAAALGVSLWLSALNARYRDVAHFIPFLVQMWFFATPVAYSSSLIPQRWQLLYGLNPMTGVVEGFRWALLGNGHAPVLMLGMSALVAMILLVSGAFYFRQMEKTFADVV